MPEQNGHERCRDFRPDECEALSHTQTKQWEQVKADKDSKEPRKDGPLDETIPARSEGTTVQMCEDRKAAERWIEGYCATGTTQRQDRRSTEDYTFVVETRVPYPVQTSGDHVRHIFGEHNEEADHMANLGAYEIYGGWLQRHASMDSDTSTVEKHKNGSLFL